MREDPYLESIKESSKSCFKLENGQFFKKRSMCYKIIT